MLLTAQYRPDKNMSKDPSPALAGEGWGEGNLGLRRPSSALRASFSREEREKLHSRALIET
jgi:hypothetical protein